MAVFLAILVVLVNVFYLALITIGMELGFKIGKAFKRSDNEELKKKGFSVQVFSILFSWIGWIYTLYLVDRYSVNKFDNIVAVDAKALRQTILAVLAFSIAAIIFIAVRFV